MKINDTQRIGALNPYQRAHELKSSSGTGKQGKKDEVQISSEAKQLLGSQGTEEQRKRLEDLKQSVSTGTYHVEANKIAEKLLPYIK